MSISRPALKVQKWCCIQLKPLFAHLVSTFIMRPFYYTGRPVIISPAPDAEVWNTIVGTNATLSCQVSANTLPMVLTRWMVVPIPFTSMPNYRVSGSSVVLLGVTYNDTGFYACNASNQCGYDYRGLPLNILGEF